MNLGGLSPDRAPPIEAPLALFYLLPLFLALAGMVLAWQGGQVLVSRWTPAALAATHLVVLGALAPVMCGALLQISPVLLGMPYPRVGLIARLTAIGLGGGGVLLGAGFLFTRPTLLLAGGATAAAGLLVFLIGSWLALAGTAVRREIQWAVRLAVVALAVTVILGLTLVTARLGWVDLPQHLRWVDTHVAWGLAGWVGLLLAGVGMELIPLFYISRAFTGWVRRMLPPVVFGLLLLVSVLGFLPDSMQPLFQMVVAALFLVHVAYNLIALRVEQGRQRPRRDANLWLWQASHVGVFGGFVAWVSGMPHSLVGMLLLGAALCFVVGSLMKIVPFLSWLDLQQRRTAGQRTQVRLPRLRALWPEHDANMVALLLGGAILGLLAGELVPVLTQFGGGLLIACALSLTQVLYRAARLRRALVLELNASHETVATR